MLLLHDYRIHSGSKDDLLTADADMGSYLLFNVSIVTQSLHMHQHCHYSSMLDVSDA